MPKHTTSSQKNVFEDIGFEKNEVANLKCRAELMLHIEKHIKSRKLTQSKASKLFGVDQPRINKLLNARIDLFTIDKLILILSRVGINVELKIAA